MIDVLAPSIDTAERMAQLGRDAWEGRERAWDAQKFLRLATTGDVLFMGDRAIKRCLIVLRIALDEAEILNLGVVPAARRQGLASRMMEAAETECARLGVAKLFLEVAVDNIAARALYARRGFDEVGLRRGYYLRPDGGRANALILRKLIAPGDVAPLAGLGGRPPR